MPHRLVALKSYWLGGGLGGSVGIFSMTIPDPVTQALVLLATTVIGLAGAYLLSKAGKIKAQGANAVAILEAQGRAQALVEGEKIAAQGRVEVQKMEAEGRLIEANSKAETLAIEAKARADANHESIEAIRAELAEARNQAKAIAEELARVKLTDSEKRHSIRNDLGSKIGALEEHADQTSVAMGAFGANQQQLLDSVPIPDPQPVPSPPELIRMSGDDLPRYIPPAGANPP